MITGGNGFIGRHLVRKLLSYKRHIVVLISNTTNINDKYLADRKLLQDMPLTFYTADIRDREDISDIFLMKDQTSVFILRQRQVLAIQLKILMKLWI